MRSVKRGHGVASEKRMDRDAIADSGGKVCFHLLFGENASSNGELDFRRASGQGRESVHKVVDSLPVEPGSNIEQAVRRNIREYPWLKKLFTHTVGDVPDSSLWVAVLEFGYNPSL